MTIDGKFISIPHGTIKTQINVQQLNLDCLISIPHGTIKTVDGLHVQSVEVNFNSTWYD